MTDYVFNKKTKFNMTRTKFTATATPRKIYVKTTNDSSQSNCKYTQDIREDVTIKATRIINIGEEIQFFWGRPDYDDNLSDDYDGNSSDYNDPSNLEKKSTGDKLKWSDDYDDNSRDDNGRSDLEKKSTGNKRKWSDEFSEDDVKEIRFLDYAKRVIGAKVAIAKSQFEFDEKRIKEMNANKSVILGKGDNLSQDEWYQLQILGDYIPQYKVDKAMTKREIDFWEEQIQEVVDKTNFILGGVYSENDVDLKKKSNGDIKSEVHQCK